MKKINEIPVMLYNRYYNKLVELQDQLKNTKFTKKIPKLIATLCGIGMVEALTPMTIYAASVSTDTIDTFTKEIGKWLVKIGIVVAMVGGVMFALGWQREDSEGKSRGLLTIMAGFMVAAIGETPQLFGFSS